MRFALLLALTVAHGATQAAAQDHAEEYVGRWHCELQRSISIPRVDLAYVFDMTLHPDGRAELAGVMGRDGAPVETPFTLETVWESTVRRVAVGEARNLREDVFLFMGEMQPDGTLEQNFITAGLTSLKSRCERLE